MAITRAAAGQAPTPAAAELIPRGVVRPERDRVSATRRCAAVSGGRLGRSRDVAAERSPVPTVARTVSPPAAKSHPPPDHHRSVHLRRHVTRGPHRPSLTGGG